MIQIRKASDRGHAKHGWLESFHTFSFGGFHDANFMGFRDLRVINEDRVLPGRGFDAHSHRDMEILSYVVDGALEHKDNMGNGSVIRPGELQLMRAGTGVTHSEYNHSKSDPVHFLQIWVLPDEEGLEPAYDRCEFSKHERSGKLCLIASPTGAQGSVRIHQDVFLHTTLLSEGEAVVHNSPPDRYIWVQVVRGQLDVNGKSLSAGDGAAVLEEPALQLVCSSFAEALLFELG